MKRAILLAALLTCCGAVGSLAQTEQPDTTRRIFLGEVEVLGTRAAANTPIAFTNLSQKQLQEVNHGLDIPFLMLSTPGVLATSDAGAGVGYTSVRVRGTDATRINVTTNDIPLNDSESHSVFWVNMPDLTSSLQDIQIQRGVGTSTNGSGQFGASINMQTQRLSLKPFAELNGSAGSFGTYKVTAKFGTGLLGDHWAFEGRLSKIASDGYRDRASSSLVSYFAQMGYFNGPTSVRFITFGGKEDTYHAWDGISRKMLDTDRTYNPNGEIKHDDVVTGFYRDQKDIYKQFHYQLIAEHGIGSAWKLRLALHYTDGYGYYQEYKNARTLKEYGLENVKTESGTLKKASLVRQKILDNGFGGGIFNVAYQGEKLSSILGAALNTYGNDHYGKVIWVENYTAPLDPGHEYYRNKGEKYDFNIYWKATYEFLKGLSAFADLQYRQIGYKITGDNDKWDWTASPERLQVLNVDKKYNFFNPKAGINYQINKHSRAYASVAVAHKEPTRNNFTDGPFNVSPKAERLVDLEAGYEFKSKRFGAGINLYYMTYKDQLVLSGKVNEIGEAMAENVPESYRAGIELTAGVNILPCLRWDINATISTNKIKNYTGYVADYVADKWKEMYTQTAINVGKTTIAFSPSFIGNSVITFSLKGFEAKFQSQWVSRQYLDNFMSRDDSLDPFFVSNLDLSYSFKLPHTKGITLGVTVYNLFNAKYETNGYSQTAALYPNGDKTQPYTLSSDPRFYPMAGINALAHLSLRF